jgi:hypothetical protein
MECNKEMKNKGRNDQSFEENCAIYGFHASGQQE